MWNHSGRRSSRGVPPFAASVRALLADTDDVAERAYRESIERLARTSLRVLLARAQLRYGEWLLRKGRLVDAREELRTAHDMLDATGLEAFADRARRALVAAGGTARSGPSNSRAT
jgi:hypothetical protein